MHCPWHAFWLAGQTQVPLAHDPPLQEPHVPPQPLSPQAFVAAHWGTQGGGGGDAGGEGFLWCFFLCLAVTSVRPPRRERARVNSREGLSKRRGSMETSSKW